MIEEYLDIHLYQLNQVFQHIHAEPYSFHQVLIVVDEVRELNILIAIVQVQKQFHDEIKHLMNEILQKKVYSKFGFHS